MFNNDYVGTNFKYGTVSAGAVPLNPFDACVLNAVLVSDFNRPNDITQPYTVLERLNVSQRDEDAFLGHLLFRDANYDDDLDYECAPQWFTDGYNSNSYLHGILVASGWPLPRFASGLRGARFPGWFKPMPKPLFEP
jgi:hypothetical protein